MTRRVTSIALTLALTLALAACSGDSPSPSQNERQSPSPSPYVISPSPSPSPDPSPAAQIGDIITFGAYEWRVLDVQNGKALIITDKIIDFRSYHSEWEDITWADCDLRAYLNGEFYNSFSAADRARIVETRNVNKDNQWFGTSGGADTTDKIFLLSLEEAVKYFGDSGQLANGNPNSDWYIDDQYNSARIARTAKAVPESDYPPGSAWTWWLRSPGYHSSGATFAHRDGELDVEGNPVHNDVLGVRPAMWLDLG
ncbi:MAG: DUF6273 domain-containing protein [Oscillospiraceae bacterium]|jgi:hypothetical protein|nr:DUF6273 domain-containing protein [Oscillospiraceae bacterium]